ncbi:uncharacterized protein LOC126842600 [Adelges cooleyi]|uniref:uncharacterized protein LOC126842600 n=1 Tax=Adelges cooleyi TaxID=133065 RepID=UPI002180765B|nr:uncharacterized protein LOC126842600 [Adelges cooleyi]
MKSNMSVALFAVYLFGLFVLLKSSPRGPDDGETSGTSETSDSLPVSLNSSPMEPSGGETSGTSETSCVGETSNRPNILPIPIRNYILNLLSIGNPKELPQAVKDLVKQPDFLKVLGGITDENILSFYTNIQLDTEFMARLIDARNNILLALKDENPEFVILKKTQHDLFEITKAKLWKEPVMETFVPEELEYTRDGVRPYLYGELNRKIMLFILKFITDVKYYG